MKVKSESEVTQSCPTLSDPMDCSPPGSSAHGIFQARVLEWGAIAFSDKIVLVSAKVVSGLSDHELVNVCVRKVQVKHVNSSPLVDFINRILEKEEMWTVILRDFGTLLIGAAYVLALLTPQKQLSYFCLALGKQILCSYSFYFLFITVELWFS